MKNVLIIFLFFLSVKVTSAQITASAKTTKLEIDLIDFSRYVNLAEILMAKGLEINGLGDNITVRIKEISSIKLSTNPLFVLDNVSIGNNYSLANNALSPEIISSVYVIRDPYQLGKWGEQGVNGVIMIDTKEGNQKAIN